MATKPAERPAWVKWIDAGDRAALKRWLARGGDVEESDPRARVHGPEETVDEQRGQGRPHGVVSMGDALPALTFESSEILPCRSQSRLPVS